MSAFKAEQDLTSLRHIICEAKVSEIHAHHEAQCRYHVEVSVNDFVEHYIEQSTKRHEVCTTLFQIKEKR